MNVSTGEVTTHTRSRSRAVFSQLKKRMGVLSVLSVLAVVVVAAAFPEFVSAQVTTANGGNIALGTAGPQQIIGTIINIALGFLAFLAVSILLYGGFLWMTSAGNEDKVQQAKNLIRAALIGLVIILSAWGIAIWLISAISDATGNPLGSGGTPCVGCSIPTGGGSNFYVVSTNPTANQTDVLLCTDVTVRMSQDVDKATVTPDNYFMTIDGGKSAGNACSTNNACASGVCSEAGTCEGDTVPGTIGFGPGATTSYFNIVPSQSFEQDTTYNVIVKGGSDGVMPIDTLPDDGKTVTGMSMSYEWSFTTGSSTDTTPPTVAVSTSSPFPANEATDICLNTVINYNFSEAMRITTFNDDQSFVLDKADQPGDKPDWVDPLNLRGWSFGSLLKYAQARPETQMEPNTKYSTRLYGGDAANNFAGAVTDSCGNALDGNLNGTSQGDPVDNFVGHAVDSPENPTTWTTGENPQCTPVIDTVSPSADYYGTFNGKLEGESCQEDTECASNNCSDAGACVENGSNTTLEITGRYLGPNPEVEFQDRGRMILATEGVNSCFNPAFLGNVQTDLSVGDYCLDYPVQTLSELKLRTPVASGGSNPRVRVAGESSEPSTDAVGILSPKINASDPGDGAPGQYLTLVGENFGDRVGQVKMKSIDGSRESIMSLPDADICGITWSSSQIIAVAPSEYTKADGSKDAWQTGDVAYIQIVRADGKHSNLAMFTFSDAVRPNLCRIEPQCSDSGGAEITLYGDRLGDQRGDRQVMQTVMTDATTGYEASISSWSNQVIQGNADAEMGNNTYWTSVYDPASTLSSNGVQYTIPCSPAPNVVEITQCDAPNGIYPAPNPRPNDQEACINASMSILFDQPMDTSSLSFSNISIEQKNKGGAFNPSFTPIRMSSDAGSAFVGSITSNPWEVQIGDNRYYGLQMDIVRTPVDNDQNGQPDGDSSTNLQPNTWYQVTITQGVKSTAGIQMVQPYVYQFKTKDTEDLCAVSTVDVSPLSLLRNSYLGQPEVGKHSYGQYTGSPYDGQCRLLDALSYDWDWNSSATNVGYLGLSSPDGPVQKVYVAGRREENQGTSAITGAVQSINDQASFAVDFGFCTSDADCQACGVGTSSCDQSTQRCSPVIQSFDPTNGDNGTWSTISGCYFGPRPGEVTMNKDGVSAVGEFPNPTQCGGTWTDNEIIIEVPDLYDSDGDGTRDRELEGGDYTFTVKTVYENSTETSTRFTVNDVQRANICRITPDTAPQMAAVDVVGNTLGTDKGRAGFLTDDDLDGIPATKDRVASRDEDTVWSDTDIDTRVAVGATSPEGTDGFRGILPGGNLTCTDDTKCTNPLWFTASCTRDSDCGSGQCGDDGICTTPDPTCRTAADCTAQCGTEGSQCDAGICTPIITDLSPSSGPHGGPVTVNGCFFGSQGAGSAVNFNTTKAEYICSDSWSDRRITVQTPAAGTIPDQSTVTVTTARGMTTAQGKTFSIVAQCSAEQIPILCYVSPTAGDASKAGDSNGDRIYFYGDNFEAQTVGTFHSGLTGLDQRDGDAASLSAVIPNGAQTGDATANTLSCASNGALVNVTCSTAADCVAGDYCVDGVCLPPTPGVCATCTPGTATAVCGAAAGCSSAVIPGSQCCAARPEITRTTMRDGATDVCPNIELRADYSESMSGWGNVRLQEKNAFGSWVNVYTIRYSGPDHKHTRLARPNGQQLDTNKEYRLMFPTSILSERTLLGFEGGVKTVNFKTNPTTCAPDQVTLEYEETGEEIAMHNFSTANSVFTAKAKVTSNGQEIQPTDALNWDNVWAPYYDTARCDNIAWIDTDPSLSAVSGSQTVRSGDQNNKETALSVQLTPTAGWTTPTPIRDSANLRTFFCPTEQLWEYIDDPAFTGGIGQQKPFVSRGAPEYPQYFDVIYCDTDEVPSLNKPVVTKGGSNDKWFMQYLFINPENAQEAFAMRLFANTENLTPLDWYRKNAPSPGNATPTTVDGYEAVKDGNTYYIATSNIVPDDSGDGKRDLYSNIVVVSFNDNDTSSLQSEIMKFISFNSNVSVAQCLGSEKSKLVRDTKRVADLSSIAASATTKFNETAAFPEPQSQTFGSYIRSLTTSKWNSWQGALGNILGTTLPTDPLNIFYAGSSFDPYNGTSLAEPWVSTTGQEDCKYDPDNNKYFDQSGNCWDPVNSTFFCPKNSSIYMYKRVSGTVAQLYGRMEYDPADSESYAKRSGVSTVENACSGAGNSNCSCFNYGIESQAGASWSPIQ